MTPPQRNPCRSVRLYRKNRRERFLTPEEYRKLGRVLDEAEAKGGFRPSGIAAIRLLLKDTIFWDSELAGFGVRVHPTGRKVYIVQTRADGKAAKRVTVGRHGVVTPEEARRRAALIVCPDQGGRGPGARADGREACRGAERRRAGRALSRKARRGALLAEDGIDVPAAHRLALFFPSITNGLSGSRGTRDSTAAAADSMIMRGSVIAFTAGPRTSPPPQYPEAMHPVGRSA